jgi:hypothetical protein
MKLNIKEIRKDGEYLEIYVKKPLFRSFEFVHGYLCSVLGDKDSFLGVRLDKTGKYLVCKMVLRNKKDIEPYKIDYENTEKSILSQYDYAILVKNYCATLINNGRKEEGLTEIGFSAEYGSVPELTMIK